MLLLTGSGGAGPIRRFVLPALFVGALFVTLFNRRPETADVVDGRIAMTISGPTMGTTYTIKMVGPSSMRADEAKLKSAIDNALNRVNESMSTYQETSEISRFNRQESTSAMPISNEMNIVLSEAETIYRLSDGAFDATVGPLVKAWGFGPDGPRNTPTDIELADLKMRTGMNQLKRDGAAKTLAKLHPDAELDLSAIAKGYGVDEIGRALATAGVTDYLVEVGGELRARGNSPKGRPWRVGIEKPTSEQRMIQEVVALSDQSMATSGDYRNYREVDGKRVSHTIDPRTAKPIEHTLASVTVIAPNCSTADAWATALNVLGPKEGVDVAKTQKLAALFMIRSEDGQFKVVSTPKFDEIRARSKGAQRPAK